MQRALWVEWFSWLASVTTTAVITGINPELLNEGTTTMTAHCAPACSQALPVKPRGVWVMGIEAWARSLESGVAEVAVFGALQPNGSVMRKILWR